MGKKEFILIDYKEYRIESAPNNLFWVTDEFEGEFFVVEDKFDSVEDAKLYIDSLEH